MIRTLVLADYSRAPGHQRRLGPGGLLSATAITVLLMHGCALGIPDNIICPIEKIVLFVNHGYFNSNNGYPSCKRLHELGVRSPLSSIQTSLALFVINLLRK